METESTCRDYEVPIEPGPHGGRCEECLDRTYPPVLDRNGDWGPLGLSLLAFVCDPCFVFSHMTATRARDDLRAVSAREAEGSYRDEHAKIRTHAVWGTLIALGRWPALMIAIAFAVVVDDMPRGYEPLDDEVEEILAAIESSDTERRDLALRHRLVQGSCVSRSAELPSAATRRSVLWGTLLIPQGVSRADASGLGRFTAPSGYP